MTKRGSWSGVLYVACVLSTWAGAAFAFELETHRRISDAAFTQSTLGKAYLEGELRLSPTMSLTWGTETRRIQEWIGEGSVHEDDGLRARGHFYDPVRDRGFTSLTCFGEGFAAPDWAFDQPTEPVDLRFSWREARDSFFHALTDKDLKPARIERGREENLARTFRALGDVLHLVQDMGSPEHTRNDAHANSRIDPLHLCGAESLFEAHIKEIGDSFTYTGYPIPRMQRFRDAWTTGDGRGFAEYTNRNFVSKDTNFTRAVDGNRAADYAQPQLNLAFREDILASDLGIPIPLPLTFFGNFVSDRITGESLPNPKMTTYSLFDRDLNLQDKGLIFTQNRFNVEAAAPFLLPRAVGYSAALLDYFFRGKLEAAIEADPTDSEKLQVTAKNASSEPLGRGTLAVYGDYADAERRPLGSWPIPGAVAPGGELPSQSFSPAKPIPARYMVVYQGDLGEEKKDNPPGFGGAVVGKATKYGGVLEELILFRTASNTWDVYFRNQFQIVLLGLSEDLPVIPMVAPWGPDIYRAEIHWGADSNHFFVKNYETRTVADDEIGVPVYRIYKIDRPDNSVSGDEPVRAVLVKTIRPRETRLPNPYGYREVWIDAPQHNRTGEMVYPYGLVFTAPYFGVQVQVSPSRQEVLSEDLGDGNGLEIYALFEAWASDEIFYLEPHGGSGQGVLGVSLIIQASTGAIVYEDPVSGSYKAQVGTAVSHGHYADGWFVAFPRTWIVSWSDRDVTRRRWVTQLRADDFYLTYDVTADNSITNEADHFVENSVQTVLIENGRPKFYLTPKQTYVAYSPYQGASPEEIFFPSALVPTMSSEKWLWIDEPDSFFGSQILRRTQYLMSTETSMKQRVGEWTPPDSTQFVIAPKIREMVMLQPGFMYAHGEPVYAIPALLGYGGSFYPLLQDLTSNVEKQKFVRFLGPDGRVDPAFTTSVPLLEDTDLRGKGRVRTDTYPSEFQAVLDTLLNPGSDSQVSWHVVPDADLVPARRR
jgi:hypothetical protein